MALLGVLPDFIIMVTRLKIAMWTDTKIHPGYWANPEISIIIMKRTSKWQPATSLQMQCMSAAKLTLDGQFDAVQLSDFSRTDA